jgi:hypothetical protein
MRAQKSETPASVVAFAPKKGAPDATLVAEDAGQHAAIAADDAGQHILALVHKASDQFDFWRGRTCSKLDRSIYRHLTHFSGKLFAFTR